MIFPVYLLLRKKVGQIGQGARCVTSPYALALKLALCGAIRAVMPETTDKSGETGLIDRRILEVKNL